MKIQFLKALGVGVMMFLVVAACNAGKPSHRSSKISDKSRPTILAAGIPKSIRPGKEFKISYNWNAVPMDKDYSVWVDIKDQSGRTVLKDDHEPPFPTKTSSWSGKFNYTQNIRVPETLVNGTYKIFAGLYDKTSGRRELNPGPKVKAGPELSYEIGSFVVDVNAPLLPLDSDKKPTLNLKGYRIAFQDEFNGPLDVSAYGPGTKWIAHTPWAGDFGDAQFTDPQEGFPFTISDGILTIEAKKEGGKWRSGLLSAVDTAGNGFYQQYGYFEMRAKFPKGPGTWPAFWLVRSPKSKMGFEVDIIEQYGREPNVMHSVLHWWYPDKNHKSVGNHFTVEDMSEDFHNYGFLINEKDMIWYFDGKELWRQSTPPEARAPLYVLINLALGSGWPIDKTPNPSKMLVDYVRVYAKN